MPTLRISLDNSIFEPYQHIHQNEAIQLRAVDSFSLFECRDSGADGIGARSEAGQTAGPGSNWLLRKVLLVVPFYSCSKD
ncbi:hypothetical protein Y032_0035g3028 [Ancylostoma ceylanicum]|uniref:Uncharacterized protein n=1 Tax=Ancylostoma ceylanicum TaxID=53326 RepID=A0A016UM05_9BILA|nr:hypothetical protein Y032_0035g3028 [Ancylostoma ceylanicum]